MVTVVIVSYWMSNRSIWSRFPNITIFSLYSVRVLYYCTHPAQNWQKWSLLQGHCLASQYKIIVVFIVCFAAHYNNTIAQQSTCLQIQTKLKRTKDRDENCFTLSPRGPAFPASPLGPVHPYNNFKKPATQLVT